MEDLKLQIDLIPIPSWNKNLRACMPRSGWDRFRKKIIVDGGNKCEVCGSNKRLSCHEKWEFDEEKRVQKLIGFGVMCGMCHHVHHFGNSQKLSKQGYLDLDAVIDHFCKINKVPREVFEKHKTEAFDFWRERSKHEWNIDLGEWAYLVD